MQNKKEKKKYTQTHSVKIIRGEGFACVSVPESGNGYSPCHKEPKGEIYNGFRDKRSPRGQILTALGIWVNGQNYQHSRKPL